MDYITTPKTSQEAYRLIHQHAAMWLAGCIGNGSACDDFFHTELKLASVMREIESHTDLEEHRPRFEDGC
jgi:hypothetical protein